MDRVASSNKAKDPRVGNTGSIHKGHHQGRNTNNGSNAFSEKKGTGIKREAPGVPKRSLRPELSNNWRQTPALNKDEPDEGEGSALCRILASYRLEGYTKSLVDEDDDEDGGVSIIPAGLRPGWVWGLSGEEIAINGHKAENSKDHSWLQL
jgi:hypothetical protein